MSDQPQTVADDIRYVLSAKEAAKDDHVTDNDVNHAKNQEVCM